MNASQRSFLIKRFVNSHATSNLGKQITTNGKSVVIRVSNVVLSSRYAHKPAQTAYPNALSGLLPRATKWKAVDLYKHRISTPNFVITDGFNIQIC